jgi:pimeloyl-ACP methyl ester carboxylesterase
LLWAATFVAATAIANRHFAGKAQRDNPPRGRFIDVNGVRLHYVDRGNGRPLVLFHGNGSMIQDFESSGLIDLAAANYRVIVFDRPGFGHSLRQQEGCEEHSVRNQVRSQRQNQETGSREEKPFGVTPGRLLF